MNKPLIDFYLGKSPTAGGYMIKDIWGWEYDILEYTHDYIQWLFPLREESNFNLDSPVLDKETIDQFKNDPLLQEYLLKSFLMMIEFYGFELNVDNNIIIKPSIDYNNRSRNWLSPYNHNYRRITRILKSMTLLGLKDYSAAFFVCLSEIYHTNKYVIGETSFEFWEKALKAT